MVQPNRHSNKRILFNNQLKADYLKITSYLTKITQKSLRQIRYSPIYINMDFSVQSILMTLEFNDKNKLSVFSKIRCYLSTPPNNTNWMPK